MRKKSLAKTSDERCEFEIFETHYEKGKILNRNQQSERGSERAQRNLLGFTATEIVNKYKIERGPLVYKVFRCAKEALGTGTVEIKRISINVEE